MLTEAGFWVLDKALHRVPQGWSEVSWPLQRTGVTHAEAFLNTVSTCNTSRSCSTQAAARLREVLLNSRLSCTPQVTSQRRDHNATAEHHAAVAVESEPHRQSCRKMRPQSAALFSSLPRSASSVRAAMAALRTTLGARFSRLEKADSPAKETILSRTNACRRSRQMLLLAWKLHKP